MHVAAHPFAWPIDLAGSRAKLSVAPTAQLTLNILINGVELASIVFAAGELEATFIAPVELGIATNDLVAIVLEGSIDATARNLAVTLVGTRVE
jgi:hypothetical protein